jgi:hypothetical protein
VFTGVEDQKNATDERIDQEQSGSHGPRSPNNPQASALPMIGAQLEAMPPKSLIPVRADDLPAFDASVAFGRAEGISDELAHRCHL